MEIDKASVMGGLFQLFDWNAKSRKKLFFSKSEVHESLNLGKEKSHGSAISRFKPEHDNGFARNARGQNDFAQILSTSCDFEFGTRAPGVVARLMGLDSLPASNTDEPLNPCIEFNSFKDSSYTRAYPSFQNEHDIVIFESVRNKLDGLTRNPLDLRLEKLQSRPIEKFQTEMIPPKSSKPVSVTHRRHLSPIKSPGFIPPKNAAYVIEAAAKLIGQSPRSVVEVKLPLLEASPVVPFKTRVVKEKTDNASRSFQPGDISKRSKEYNSAKHSKKQPSFRGLGPSDDGYMYEVYKESNVVGPQKLKSMEKPASLSDLEKGNIHKRNGVSSLCDRNSRKQKEQNEITPSCVNRNQKNMTNKMQNKSLVKRSSEVLTPNHQKQNCASTKDRENVEPSVSHPKDRKDSNLSTNYICQHPRRIVNNIIVDNVVPPRKTKKIVSELGKEVSSSGTKTTSKKKVRIDGNIQSDKCVVQKILVMKEEKSNKCDVVNESNSKWDASDKKNHFEVVSFTFTSPIKKSDSGSNSCGFNIATGDALNVLLEQKLKELTSKVELSRKDLSEGLEDIEEQKGNGEHQMYLSMQGVIPISSQPTFSGHSCNSDDVDRTSSGMLCSSSHSSTRKSDPVYLDVEISDTTSSLSAEAGSESVTSSLCAANLKDSSCWELQYVVDILHDAELMFEDFALGQAHKIMAPGLFDRLENQKMKSKKNTEDCIMLERRVLFDCVSACLESRCGRLLAGSYKVWAKWMTLLHQRHRLALEVHREISSWTVIEELMVDELVDKDMRSKEGRWVDFEIEESEEGVEIWKIILTDLVNELIDDFIF